MGTGYEYFCEKCQKDFPVFLGSGKGYLISYEVLLEDIKSGKYGEEIKTAALSNSNVVIDALRHLYICSCGYWENDYGLSLYIPKEVARIDSLFVSLYTHRDIFQILYEYNHQCPECGKQMNEADYQPIDLRCPECKTLCSYRGEIDWD